MNGVWITSPGEAVSHIIVCQIKGGEGNGNPLQYACLENPMDGGD